MCEHSFASKLFSIESCSETFVDIFLKLAFRCFWFTLMREQCGALAYTDTLYHFVINEYIHLLQNGNSS